MIHREIAQFKSGNFQLTGQWDGPANQAAGRGGVIFCHGFTGNRFESRRMFARLSARLAQAGLWTFRFDHRGCGDSEGDFSDFTADGLIEDLDAAVAHFHAGNRINPARAAVVGFSLGGLSASYLLTKKPEFRTACLLAPVARPDIIRDRLATYPDFPSYKTRGWFDYMGSRVSAGYIDEIGKLDPVSWAAGFPQEIFFGQAAGDPIVKPEQAQLYMESRQHPGDQLLLIPGGDHFFGTADNLDLVIGSCERWLLERLVDEPSTPNQA